MKCERCKAETKKGYELFDYCAKCSKNLCPECMAQGCCKTKPAESGRREDHEEN